MSYREAGVDIDAGNALVQAIKPLAKATARPGAAAELGGFGGLFDLKAAGYQDPILVAATDGVGTKLEIAIAAGCHGTVGIDLVAMCVNDLIVQGAEPLFFLDYMATGRLETEVARDVVTGIARGCEIAGCALIGGETAEMPGFYGAGHYDLAGFAVGAAERGALLTGDGLAAGDKLLGLASDGLHSNGFSLVRRIVADTGLSYDSAAPFAADEALGSALLRPTRIYVRSCLAAIHSGGVKALAHITGGGLLENLPRVLPEGLAARLDGKAWPAAAVFAWLAEAGRLPSEEMLRTFNCGLGMALVVAPERAEALSELLREAGERVYDIGTLEARVSDDPAIVIENAEAAWQGSKSAS